MNRKMMDLNIFVTSVQLKFFTDASAGEKLGFGCVFNNRWAFGQWEEGFIKKSKPSTEFLELYALCVGLITWQELLADCRIIIFCDNIAVVNMVNNLSSSCK